MDKYRIIEDLPIHSDYLAWAEFIEITGTHPSRLGELLELGWLNPVKSGDDYLFSKLDVYRLRKLERICSDFNLHVLGGSIIVDLLDQIEVLERKVEGMEHLLDTV